MLAATGAVFMTRSVVMQRNIRRLLSVFGLALLLLGGSAMASKVNDMSPVNINTATAEQLAQQLQGVGPAKAQAIVEYRELHGEFSSVEDLLEVKGIGTGTLDKNKARITLE